MNETLAFNLERMMDETLIGKELLLEEESYKIGVERIQEKIAKKGLESTIVGQDKVKDLLPLMVAGIEAWKIEQATKRNKPAVFKYIDALNSVSLAYLTAKVCVNSISCEKAMFTNAAMILANKIGDFVRYDVLLTVNKEALKEVEQRLKFAGTAYKRTRILTKALADLGFETQEWSSKTCLALGTQLLAIFEATTGYIEVKNSGVGRRMAKVIVCTPEALQWLETTDIKEALISPFRYPMLVPPQPWTTPYDGGYYNKSLHSTDLVWTKNKIANRRLENQHMPEVYSALNAIQATPFRINKKVAHVHTHYFDNKMAVAGLPSFEPKELADKPWDDTLPQEEIDAYMANNSEEFTNWKRKRSEVHNENAKTASKGITRELRVNLCKRFYDEAAIYFVGGLDFRSREYASGGNGTISPQADDAGKSMLEFAVGKPIGEHGGYWLAFHLANTFGKDKLPLDERVQWAVDNSEMIMSCALCPLEVTKWHEAAEPFAFLAACIEWYGFMCEGDKFVSHLPISVDGSCSGLQHFGAMLKDTSTLESVNVLPTQGKPSDVYMKVMQRVAKELEADTSTLAKEWSTRLSRSTVKTSTMTTPYGVSMRGIKDQIKNSIVKATDKGTIEPFSVSASEAADYLTPLVKLAISDVVTAATEAMDWLKTLAKVTGKAGVDNSWTTPTGFKVTQDYTKQSRSRHPLIYNGQIIKLTLTKGSAKIDVRKASSAYAPNFVHSMDAAHLMKTTNTCVANGVDTFAMIHDSFATHCSSIDTLGLATRWEFKEMYSGNVLEDLYLKTISKLPDDKKDDLPPPPLQGNANLDAVLHSDFFFA